MIRKGFLLFVISLVGCSKAKKELSNFLQSEEIKLAQPILTSNDTIVDSTITINADLRMDGVQLFYTNDGTEPTMQSSKYEKALEITKAGLYTFKGFHPDWKSGDIASIKIYQKGHTPKHIEWQTKASEKYPGLGDFGLIDNKKGALSFLDKQWMGFNSKAKAKVVFSREIKIKKLTIGYLIDTGSWIFPPESITIQLNATDSLNINIPKIDAPISQLSDIEIPINRAVNELTITANNLKELPDWHPGKGLNAWLFMDEWIFN